MPPGMNTYDPNEYWQPPALSDVTLRRRPPASRAAA